ncbi:ABC transporter substrate binding protein [Sulfurospirillum arcachonense]|uniref:ABC transporter substrate binding protein n=1 Tax=Sulfurospirillum arcachonense TaxID=57666 RepID=UPI0004698A9E|nr:ABC transporter substrate binding protein [Sulfurospirillum arcachonense]
MKFIFLILAFLSCLLANSPKEVLLLHSYNKGLKWTDGISNGIKSVLDKHPEYEITTEYMDSKRIDTKEYFQALFTLYQKKFTHRNYKVIITADNYAFKFALDHHKKLFNNIPIVFCGVENFDKKDVPLYLQRFVTGVMEYKDIIKNLRLIKDMIPDIKTLYIISDDSFSSLAIKKQILDSSKVFKKDFNIIYDNSIDLNTIQDKLNALPEPSAVLFTSLYKDKYGEYIPYYKLRELFNKSKYPMFAVNKIHLGQGIMGGVMINPYEQGTNAAEEVLEIVEEGRSPLQIDVRKPISSKYFDHIVLNKYGFSEQDIPFGAIMINQPKDFFEKNRDLIDSLVLILPLLLILIIFLIINIYKRVSVEIELLEQNKLDSVLLNNVESAIFWMSKDNILLGCNQTSWSMLNITKEQILGKHMQDIFPELNKLFSKYDESENKIEATLKHTTEEPIDVLIRRKLYLNNKNEEAGIVTIINDITDIKKLETQRKKDEQFMIQRSKLSEIGEMITSIAHQWKAPLVEISAIAQELQYKRKKIEITQRDADEFVNDIMTQVTYMTNTIDDFRSFIKPSTHKSEFSVNQAITDLLKVIDHNIKYNYIEMEIVYENDLEYIMYGYPNEFKQSILNIINNAKDSILLKKQKEDIVGKISLHVNSSDGTICISIKDNGIGIAEKELNSIFEPFISSKEDGDGFGLYMVKLIVEDKMGGHIEAIPCDDGAEILICVKGITSG